MISKLSILCLIAAAFLFGGCANKCRTVQGCDKNVVVCDEPVKYRTVLF